MKRTIRFRQAEANDASLISHIIATSWRKSYRNIIAQDYLDRLPDQYWAQSARAWLESGRFYGLLIYQDDKPCGCCIYGRGRDEDHDTWGEIVSLYMLPEAARQGLGSQLFLRALDDLREEGYTRFYLWAIRGADAADAFYRRHGFHATTDHIAYSIGGEPGTDVRYVRVEDQANSSNAGHQA